MGGEERLELKAELERPSLTLSLAAERVVSRPHLRKR